MNRTSTTRILLIFEWPGLEAAWLFLWQQMT